MVQHSTAGWRGGPVYGQGCTAGCLDSRGGTNIVGQSPVQIVITNTKERNVKVVINDNLMKLSG